MFWTIAAINALVVFLLIYYKPIGFMIFDILMSIYTFVRVKYEIYDPFKPELKIHKVSYFCREDWLDSTKEPVGQEMRLGKSRLVRHSCEDLSSLLKLINEFSPELYKESIALSITYSFSDLNKKFIKLIDLKSREQKLRSNDLSSFIEAVFLEEEPTYNEYNYDYSVLVLRNEKLLSEELLALVKANLEAYLHRTPTFEAEQTLECLRREPELMEFLYNKLEDSGSYDRQKIEGSELDLDISGIEDLYKNGYISFLAEDELGSQFLIQVCNKGVDN